MAITVRCPRCEHLWRTAPQVLPLPLKCPSCGGPVPSPMGTDGDSGVHIPARRLRDRARPVTEGPPVREYVEPADPAWYLFVLTVLPLGMPMLAARIPDYPLWKMGLATVLAIGLVTLGLGVAYRRRISPWHRATILLASALTAYTLFAVDLVGDPPPRGRPVPPGPKWVPVPPPTRRG